MPDREEKEKMLLVSEQHLQDIRTNAQAWLDGLLSATFYAKDLRNDNFFEPLNSANIVYIRKLEFIDCYITPQESGLIFRFGEIGELIFKNCRFSNASMKVEEYPEHATRFEFRYDLALKGRLSRLAIENPITECRIEAEINFSIKEMIDYHSRHGEELTADVRSHIYSLESSHLNAHIKVGGKFTASYGRKTDLIETDFPYIGLDTRKAHLLLSGSGLRDSSAKDLVSLTIKGNASELTLDKITAGITMVHRPLHFLKIENCNFGEFFVDKRIIGDAQPDNQDLTLEINSSYFLFNLGLPQHSLTKRSYFTDTKFPRQRYTQDTNLEFHRAAFSTQREKQLAANVRLNFEHLISEFTQINRSDLSHEIFIAERNYSLRTFSLEWFYWNLYGWTSSYGFSVLRPFITLVGLIFLFSFIYRTHTASFYTALKLSASNILGPFGLRQVILPKDLISELPGIIQAAVVLQSIFGITLVFLIGLALRNQFRLKL